MTTEWQQRVIDERVALRDKISALIRTFDGPGFRELPEIDQLLLIMQYDQMYAYQKTLRMRIERFT